MTIAAAILIVGGLFFLTVSCMGLIRLPDFYSRTHAVGKSETLGTLLVLIGLAVYSGLELNTIKILIILVFVAIANPTATHAILRGALYARLELWIRKERRSDHTMKSNEESLHGEVDQHEVDHTEAGESK